MPTSKSLPSNSRDFHAGGGANMMTLARDAFSDPVAEIFFLRCRQLQKKSNDCVPACHDAEGSRKMWLRGLELDALPFSLKAG